MTRQKREDTTAIPFTMQVIENPKVQGISYGVDAMKKSGAQQEFIAVNIMQAAAMKSAVILRSGDPPQYDKHRSPKSGVNLTKTSKQGFFLGALAQEERFARLEHGAPKPHNAKDKAHLALSPTDPDYQHTMQLDINMRDILRVVGPGGDMRVLGFDPESGFLRLEYKEGKGPSADLFNGQFVVNLNQGKADPQFFSREWNRPENDPGWNEETKVITKPRELAAIPDHVYQRVFGHTFVVGYTEDKLPVHDPSTIKKANVFANRPRSAEEFKTAMGETHPHYDLIKNCQTLPAILQTLKALPTEDAHNTILEVYDKGGSIVAGDWDGMALGHPPTINPKYAEVIDGFAPGEQGLINQRDLINRANAYLEELQADALGKEIEGKPLTAFDKKILSIHDITDIASEFAIARAGRITAHEFLFQQVINDVYRDKNNQHFGEKYDTVAVQKVMDDLLKYAQEFQAVPSEHRAELIKNMLKVEMLASSEQRPTLPVLDKLSQHLMTHFSIALQNNMQRYVVPHMQHDMNVNDLYQHGFDMRNPYGSNLEGAWLLVTEDGALLYGETQEQLIEVLLTGDFLKNNHIDVTHGADMAAGWGRIIQRQQELGQIIPPQTLEKYEAYVAQEQQREARLKIFEPPKVFSIEEQRSKQQDFKQQFSMLKADSKKEKEAELTVESTQKFIPQ